MPGPARPPFPSGRGSANPGGRPKKLQDLVREMERRGMVTDSLDALHAIIRDEEHPDRTEAIKVCLGYVYGKPRQQLSVESTHAHLHAHVAFAEDWEARARELPIEAAKVALEHLRAADRLLEAPAVVDAEVVSVEPGEGDGGAGG